MFPKTRAKTSNPKRPLAMVAAPRVLLEALTSGKPSKGIATSRETESDENVLLNAFEQLVRRFLKQVRSRISGNQSAEPSLTLELEEAEGLALCVTEQLDSGRTALWEAMQGGYRSATGKSTLWWPEDASARRQSVKDLKVDLAEKAQTITRLQDSLSQEEQRSQFLQQQLEEQTLREKRLLSRQRRELSAAMQSLQNTKSELQARHQSAELQASELIALRRKIESLEASLLQTEQRLDAEKRLTAQQSYELGVAAHSLQSYDVELGAQKRQAELQASELIAAQRLASDRERELRQCEQHRDALEGDLLLTQQWHRRLLDSRSWRITAPLRAVYDRAAMLRRTWPGTVKQLRLSASAMKTSVCGAVSRFRRRLIPASWPARRYAALQFPSHDAPDVSIVIPVYNQFEHTYECLKSLIDCSARCKFEVIVVDDCSSDITNSRLTRIRGLQVVRNQTNSGFIASCNRGAQLAKGKYIVFLNNDTTMTTGWLDELHDTFQRDPQAGLVGAKLVYPNRKLQEAGGIVWRDGSACNFGRNDDPEKPEYGYMREVDYCSGACIMVPQKLFSDLGGFDTRYSPAYYEDTDLAFQVRKAGYKVLYQPLSEIIHWEGGTSGVDVTQGAKRWQILNQPKFIKKWIAELRRQSAPEDGLQRACDRRRGRRLLVVDICCPRHDQDSGSLRMFNLLEIFQKLGFQITFIPEKPDHLQRYGGDLRRRGIKVLHRPYLESIESYLAEHGKEYDAVVLSRVEVAINHINAVRRHAPEAVVIFDTVDLYFVREQRQAELLNDPRLREAARARKCQELLVARKSDYVLVVSHVEQERLRVECSELKVHVVSNVHQIRGTNTPFSARRDILFIGGFEHLPNVDAVTFFVSEVFPLIEERIPDARLWIVGSNPPPVVTALASEKIHVTGYVPDVTEIFNACKLSIAPLRFGAGVKGKVNQSMSLGLPVVLTHLAAEGMHLTDGVDALIASDAREMAEAVSRLYVDEDLWNRLSRNGIENVRAHFSFEAVGKSVEALCDEAGLLPATQRDVETESPLTAEMTDALSADAPGSSSDAADDASTVEYGMGFYQDEGGWRWMSNLGMLMVSTEKSVRPSELKFRVICGRAEEYEKFPFTVRIEVGESCLEPLVFDIDCRQHEICVDLPGGVCDLVVLLESSTTFVGSEIDSRKLSVRVTNPTVATRDTGLNRSPANRVKSESEPVTKELHAEKAPKCLESQTQNGSQRPSSESRVVKNSKPPESVIEQAHGEVDPVVKAIAFYLPQFHPIPENDAWWGKGFTEWTNVTKARPLFAGHYQPQLPGELGFYDLRMPEIMERQAELARRHGIHGFCYYHYWFHGKRLLERPFETLLRSGKPDFPFCLCWANEPWSRRWDGSESDVLQSQEYSEQDDLNHIHSLLEALGDRRAITIEGRPLLLIYRADQLPNPARTTDMWRDEVARAGLKGLYLAAIETGWDAGWDATKVGFDAKVLFQPQFSLLATVERLQLGSERLHAYDYQKAWPVLADPPAVSYPRYETVFPSWDNTARKGEYGWVVHNSTPAAYEAWLRSAVERAMQRPADRRVVFINAWNEWAEGAHLEPDMRNGREYLEATRRALCSVIERASR